MYFALSKDQELFRSSVKGFLESKEGKEVARRYIEEKDCALFKEVWQGLAELGVLSINVPEAYGGTDLKQIDLVPVFEETGAVLLPGLFLETTGFFTPVLTKFGSEEQKKAFLPKIAEGKLMATIAFLEDRSNLFYTKDAIKMRAVTNGEQTILTGKKLFVAGGKEADLYIVPVRTKSEAISLYIVDRNKTGVEVKQIASLDETREITEVHFKDLRLSKEERLGEEGEGWKILQEGLLHLHAAISASICGSMESVVKTARDYANTREQFGQAIGTYQAIKHKIVDMKVDLETAKSLAYYANWAVENEVEDREVAVYTARAFATEAFIRSAGDNIQIHGGIGFTKELDCHLYLKRAHGLENYFGSVNDHYTNISEGLGW